MKKFYVGTYTNGGSQGIYRITYKDTNSMEKSLAAACESPSYLCMSPFNHVLYAVKEDVIKGKGAIMAYKINNNSLELINQVEASTQGLVHLVVNHDNTYLFTVCYRDAVILMYEMDKDYGIGALTCQKKHTGHSIHPVRQSCAHAHSVWLTPEENYLCVCDLGMDEMIVYSIDYRQKTITEKTEWCVKFPQGSGPRHMVFHPQGHYAYVYTELSCEVYVMRYCNDTGFSIIQKEGALMEHDLENEKGYRSGAAIRISKDGKYLYTSTRGEDSITIYEVDENGYIHKKRVISCGGKHPRDFILSEDETLLLCANRDSNDVTIFQRSKLNGELSFATSVADIDMPVAIIEQR